MKGDWADSSVFSHCVLLVLLTWGIPHYGKVDVPSSRVDAFVVKSPRNPYTNKHYHRCHRQRSGSDAYASVGDVNEQKENTVLSPPQAHRHEQRSISLGRHSPLARCSDSLSLGNDDWLDPPVSVPDPYGWMRWSDDATMQEKQQILDHITMENDYKTKFFVADGGYRKSLQQELVKEFQSLLEAPIDGNDNVGEIFQLYHCDGYYYYSRRPSNQAYPIHCRIQEDLFQHFIGDHIGGAKGEEVLLDENIVAKHFLRTSQGTFFSLQSLVPILLPCKQNTNNRTLFGLAFSVDLVGDESYSLFLLPFPICPGLDETRPQLVANTTSGSIECVITETFGEYSFSLHYVAMDKNLCRPHQWVEWEFGNKTHTILYTETDTRFWGDLSQTSDGRYLIWTSRTSSGTLGSILSLNRQHSKGRRPLLMRVDTLSNVVLDHRNDHWWVLDLSHPTNTSTGNPGQDLGIKCDSPKTQLYISSKPDASALTPVVWSHHLVSNLHSTATIYLEKLATFSQHIVLQGRREGLRCLWILRVNEQNGVTNAYQALATNEELAYYIDMTPKQDFCSPCCMIWYESMVTPPQIWTVSLIDGHCRIIYAKNIAGYVKSAFCCQRLTIPSRDGITSIPVSVVHHKNVNFPCPIHMLGYGAYGHSLEPSFSTIRLPMLNRGMACVVAHVRGGGEMGRRWHDSGRSSFKTNSINDFVDVAAWLIDHNMTRSNLLVAEGRSAGGLLVASAMNQQPKLFHCVVLGVPFLDILCTMADSTIPLTTTEWDEWGNPHTQQGFQSIREYAPMHNIVTNTSYPSCLLIGGRHDPRVPYWEPLKFAASLRHSTQSRRPILVKIDSSAGHSFGNNRTKYFEEMAFIYAFIIDQVLMQE